MGNIVNTVNKFSGNNADGVPFRRCSYLPNSTCDENGSSVTRKSASAINGSINGHGTLYKDVGNEEMHLATDSTSKPGCRGDTNHCTNKERETRNVIVHTDSRQNGDATNSDNAVLICNQTAGHMSYGLDGESNRSSGSLAAVVSEVLVSKAPLEKRCRTNLQETGDLENTPNAHVSKRSRLHRVSPANSLFDREACDDLIDSAHNLDCSRTPNASVHDETVPNEDKTPCTSLDVRGCEGTPRASLKRRVIKKRTKREASYPTTPLNGNTGALVVSVILFSGYLTYYVKDLKVLTCLLLLFTSDFFLLPLLKPLMAFYHLNKDLISFSFLFPYKYQENHGFINCFSRNLRKSRLHMCLKRHTRRCVHVVCVCVSSL